MLAVFGLAAFIWGVSIFGILALGLLSGVSPGLRAWLCGEARHGEDLPRRADRKAPLVIPVVIDRRRFVPGSIEPRSPSAPPQLVGVDPWP